jgi:hypothetical protein
MLVKKINDKFITIKMPVIVDGKAMITNDYNFLKTLNIYKVNENEEPPEYAHESYLEYSDGEVYLRYKEVENTEETGPFPDNENND